MGSACGRDKLNPRRVALAWVVTTLAVLATACSVDSSGVIRASGADGPAVAAAPEQSTGECTDLLARLQEGAVDLVGPTGFIGAGLVDQGVPFRGGRGFIEDGFGGFGGQAGPTSVGERAVTVDGLLAVVRDGRLYVFGDAGDALGSVWLDALPQQRFPTPETGLLARGSEVVAISPAVGLQDDAGDRYSATVIQRIDVSDPADPTVIERLSVRGEVTGTTSGDDAVRLAVSVPPPALDFLYASTTGGEDAATEHNRALLATTTLEDWLGGYELTVSTPDGLDSTTTGLLGGCEVIAAEGADSALGATVLIDLGTDGGLADLDATTVLGQGRVSFGADATYVLSPRSHSVGFGDPGGQGAPRVVISRLVDGAEGPEIDGVGIMPGVLSPLPTPSLSDGHLLVFTSTFDDFGNGGFEARSLRNVDGEIREVDTTTLPVQPWDTFRLESIGDDLLLVGQQGSALIDVSDPTSLAVSGVQGGWDRGEFVGAPQFAPYSDGMVLSVAPGPVAQQFGSIDSFLDSLGFGEFGFGWEPWQELQGPTSVRLIDGDPIDGESVAVYDAQAFALWPISADPEAGEVVVGAIALRADDGELFDGALVLRREGERLVEAQRWPIEAPEVTDFGATECEKVRIEGNLMDVIGLWNQTPLRCDQGVPGGMVGHTCVAMTIPDISPQDLRNWFGFENPDVMSELDELSAAAAAGASFQACTPRQAGLPNVVRDFVEGDDGDWLIGLTAVYRVAPGNGVTGPVAIEPPYTI